MAPWSAVCALCREFAHFKDPTDYIEMKLPTYCQATQPLSNYRIIESSNYRIIELSNYRIIELLNY